MMIMTMIIIDNDNNKLLFSLYTSYLKRRTKLVPNTTYEVRNCKEKKNYKSTPKTTLEVEFATSTIEMPISLQSGCRAGLDCRWSRGERNGYFAWYDNDKHTPIKPKPQSQNEGNFEAFDLRKWVSLSCTWNLHLALALAFVSEGFWNSKITHCRSTAWLKFLLPTKMYRISSNKR